MLLFTTTTTTNHKKPPPSRQATLQDFVHFHGMLCHPATAARCIRAFDNGSVLFMPQNYTFASLADYDCAGGTLTLWSYYALVLVSLTGLWIVL